MINSTIHNFIRRFPINTSDKTILLNTFYQIAGKCVISGLSIITTILLTRSLGVKNFGEYSIVFAYIGFFSIFADFSLGTLVIRIIAGNGTDKKTFEQLFSLRFFLTIIISLVGIVVSYFVPYAPVVRMGIIIASVGNIFLLLASLIWGIFQGQLKFQKSVLLQILNSFLSVILIGIGFLFHQTLLFFVFVYLLSNAVTFFVTFFSAPFKPSFFAHISKTDIVRIFHDAWPLALGLIVSTWYFKIDSIMLSFYFNPATYPDLSFYTLAYKVFEVSIVFGGFFTQTLYPYFSKEIFSREFSSVVKRYFLYSGGFAVACGIAVFLFAPLAIWVLGGSSYASSIPSLQILSLASCATILSGFFLSIALAGQEQKLLLYYAIVALFFNVGINLFILPRFSFLGASWTTVVTQFFIMITNGYAAYIVLQKKKRSVL